MFKFVTLYRKVDDPDSLDAFFSGTHLPLAEQLPNLQKSEVFWINGKPGGLQSRFYLMYTLCFDDRAAFDLAFFSEIGIQLVQALKPWADAKIITWFFAEAYEEDAATLHGRNLDSPNL